MNYAQLYTVPEYKKLLCNQCMQLQSLTISVTPVAYLIISKEDFWFCKKVELIIDWRAKKGAIKPAFLNISSKAQQAKFSQQQHS